MSLINQMLKDLDARHEGDSLSKLQREVRALPSSNGSASLRRVVVALTIGALLAGGWWAYERLVAGGGRSEVQVKGPEDVHVIAAALTPKPPPALDLPTTADAGVSAAMAVDGMKLSPSLDRLPEQPAASQVQPLAPVKPPKATGAPATAVPERRAVVEKTLPTKPVRDQVESDYRRAVGLVNGARVSESIDLLIDLLRIDGGHIASRQLLARLLIEQRRLDEAMAVLAEGLSTQPGQVGWAMQLARLQMERGDMAGAARTLKVSQPYAINHADFQGFAGLVAHRQGRQKDSAEHYQAAIRVSPSEGRWWLGLGLALEADGSVSDAREAFLRARASGNLNADLLALVDQKLR